MKICKICGIEKDESEFYSQSNKKYLKPYCKTCNKKKSVEWHKKNNYAYFKSNNYRENRKDIKFKIYSHQRYIKLHEPKLYNAKYPERKKAANAIQHLEKTSGFDRHHWSYNEEHWKDVIYITRSIHRIAHKFMIYDQERMMFRKLDGVLLDTREEHLEYINSLNV